MSMKVWWIVLLTAIVMMIAGCNSSDGGSNDETDVTGEELVDVVIADWLDVDFSLKNPDGTTDTDADGQIDTNDAVNFVEALKALGYQIPETTIDGLYHNYYTPDGYMTAAPADSTAFSYSLDSAVSEADLQAHDWSGLQTGDMIFVDHDKDLSWDNCALYIGAYDEYSHAVVFASDYFDKVVIEDLDGVLGTSILVLDIDNGYSDVREPDLDHFAEYYNP